MSTSSPIIELRDVGKVFSSRRTTVPAVADASVKIREGEVVSLVGESGSGKTTLARIVAGLETTSLGDVLYRGRPLNSLDRKGQREYRAQVQYVHQDAYASLNPTRTVFSTLSVSLFRNKAVQGHANALRRSVELLELVDLTPAEDYLNKFPHQLSGGQRQRVSLARALSTSPKLIVADESTSMLDVSIRISLLNTLLRLREELNIGFLFITHDLALAKYFGINGRTLVMYRGRIVEEGRTNEVIELPSHPYTRALIESIPEPDPILSRSRQRVLLPSERTVGANLTTDGCPFAARCPLFKPGLCDQVIPTLLQVPGEQGTHAAACFRLHDVDEEMPLRREIAIARS